MQLLLMLPKDIIFLQPQLSTSLTDMSIFQEDHYLNVLPLMKSYAFKSYDSDYVCVIVDYLDKKIIDVLPSRHKNVLINYFMLIPRVEREKVKYVSFDMLNTYRIVAKHVFPNCICIVDHFHMIQDLNKRVDKVRIRVQKKYKKIKDDLKKKIKNKTITVEEKLELDKLPDTIMC